MNLGRLHVLIVHFPIALAIAAALADLLWLLSRRAMFRHAGLYCLLGALIVTPPVVLTGYLLLDSMESNKEIPAGQVELAEDHEDMGFATLGVVVGVAILRLAWHKKPARWLPFIYAFAVLVMLACVSITGALGGELVYTQEWIRGIFGPA